MCIYIYDYVYIYIYYYMCIYIYIINYHYISGSLSLSLSLSLYNGFLWFFLGCDLWIPQKAMQNHSGGVCSLFPPLSHPHTVAPDGTESPIIPRPCLPGWALDGQQMEEIPSPVEGKKRMRVPN